MNRQTPPDMGSWDHTAPLVAHELEHDLDEVRDVASRLRDALDRGPADPTVTGHLDRLDRGLERLHASVEQLLQRSPGMDTLQLAPVRLAPLVDRVIAAHDARGHVIEREVSAAVTTLDAVKVERILDNLLVNAIRHTPADARVRVQAWTEPGGQVHLAVEDDGPGLPADQRATVLEAPRAPNHPTGLALVAHLAKVHGGVASVEPGPYGAGLRVEVSLATRSPS